MNAIRNACFAGSINAVRGGFTLKLLNLQVLSLARAPSRALGGTLNKYLFSYLIFILNLKFLF
jgi:hypothetical protein